MNSKGFVGKILVLIVLIIVVVGFVSIKLGKEEEAKAGTKKLLGRAIDGLWDLIEKQDYRKDVGKTITIANWNLQIFGDKKASNSSLMEDYVNYIDDYDIIFIQEIRDKDGSSFEELCDMMSGYECEISSRAGRSSSKEQYGLIYNKNVELTSFTDYNPDSKDRWERPPIKFNFVVEGYEFSVYNIHIKPSDVQKELEYLEDVAYNEGNVVVLGDLNADCSYYNEVNEDEFNRGWNWVIGNDDDTTVGASECAYDRIILNDNAYGEFISRGIVSEGITKEHSDHYLVYVEIEVEE